jgi:hypothetical protein
MLSFTFAFLTRVRPDATQAPDDWHGTSPRLGVSADQGL